MRNRFVKPMLFENDSVSEFDLSENLPDVFGRDVALAFVPSLFAMGNVVATIENGVVVINRASNGEVLQRHDVWKPH